MSKAKKSRSAVTGKYVDKKFAKVHKDTTVNESVKSKKKK